MAIWWQTPVMRKIPTLFARDFRSQPAYVINEVTPGCEWVTEGHGIATRKYDGTCVMLDDDGRWWARREIKPGKSGPANYVTIEFDPETGKTVGWEPIEQSAFARWHAEAVPREAGLPWNPGTFELIGPKVNGNPEGVERHTLIRHSTAQELKDAPRDFDGLRDWLWAQPYEGVVWHHDDGRMVKLKRRDFPRQETS